MTTEEFKKAKPELAHLEGVELMNAMEDYFLRLQEGYCVTKTILPFWKRYTFRWLFYRRRQNWRFEKADYTASKRCKICKKPTGMMFVFGGKMLCMTGHEYIEEPNKSLAHILYIIWNRIYTTFWLVLDWLHVCRYGFDDRYGMMGDEMAYVHHWEINYESGETKPILKKRKWWQYLFIERKFRPKF